MTAIQDHDQTRGQLERVIAGADQAAGGPAEEAAEVDVHLDRMRTFSRTDFSRMKLTWTADEQLVMEEVRAQSDKIIEAFFREAFDVLEDLYRHVRKPKASLTTGEVRKDVYGRTVWETDEHGHPIENWLALGDRERENALYRITVHLHEWEQTAAKLWTDAMFAKGLWEEAFSHAFFGAPGGRPTVDDRTQYGRKSSMESRYFALFRSSISRRADAVIRSMTRVYTILLKDAR